MRKRERRACAGRRISASSGDVDGIPITVNGQGSEEPSPMQVVGAGLLGCMAIDVVEILKKGRHDLKGLEATITADRSTIRRDAS